MTVGAGGVDILRGVTRSIGHMQQRLRDLTWITGQVDRKSAWQIVVKLRRPPGVC